MYIDKYSGKKYTQKQIDINTSRAKKQLRANHREEFGAEYCKHCFELNQSEGFIPPNTLEYTTIDCSHIISVDKCKKEGFIEMIWSLYNMELLCRFHHIEFEDSLKSLHFRE